MTCNYSHRNALALSAALVLGVLAPGCTDPAEDGSPDEAEQSDAVTTPTIVTTQAYYPWGDITQEGEPILLPANTKLYCSFDGRLISGGTLLWQSLSNVKSNQNITVAQAFNIASNETINLLRSYPNKAFVEMDCYTPNQMYTFFGEVCPGSYTSERCWGLY